MNPGCSEGKELNTLRSWQRSLWEPRGGFFKPIPFLQKSQRAASSHPCCAHPPHPIPETWDTPKSLLAPLIPLSRAWLVPVSGAGGAGRARGRGCELCQPAQMLDSLSHTRGSSAFPSPDFRPGKVGRSHGLPTFSSSHPWHLPLLVLGMGEQRAPPEGWD